MRIAIASAFGCGVGIWKRLADEGHDVAVWIEPTQNSQVGRGLVNVVGGWGPLFDFAKMGSLAGIPTIMLFDSSGHADEAEEARRWGLTVIGGGRFCDRLEHDRSFGFKMAESVGAAVPPHAAFDSFDAALDYARGLDDTPVYFKSNRYLDADATFGAENRKDLVEYLSYVIRRYGSHGKCILQQKIEGTPISTARWWNGRTFVGPYESTVEHKKLLNDDLGPSTGCSFNAIWFYQQSTPAIAAELGWDKLAYEFAKNDAPPGLYDMNAVVTSQGQAYFLEWTPRFGYDSEPTSLHLYPDLGQLLSDVAFGTGEPQPSEDLAYSVRLSVPPYPWEHSKKNHGKTCIGTYVSGDVGDLWSGSFIGYELAIGEGGLEVASPEGIVGLAYAQGGPLSKLAEQAEATAKAIKCPGLQYRTDGAKVLKKDAKAIKEAGCEVHRDVVR